MAGQPSGGKSVPEWDEKAYQRSKDEALAYTTKDYEEKLRNPLAKRVPLPNFPSGAGMPRPLGLNFYEERTAYPDYLLCIYDVEEHHYDQSDEAAWLKSALLQIRAHGRGSFPAFKWVAVVICNRAEHKGADTFEESHKVGEIFSSNEVFDRMRDAAQLVARARMDRHPFVYDPTQPTPGQQQRWTIVERDMKARAPKR